MRTSPRRLTALAVVAALLTLAAGCGAPEDRPAPAPSASAQLTLLKRYVPWLQLDSRDPFGPVAVSALANHRLAKLERADGTLIADGRELSLEFLRAGTYPNGQVVKPDDVLTVSTDRKWWAGQPEAARRSPTKIYGWVKDGSGGRYTYLNYLYFYVFNDWAPGVLGSVGDHEGDFELLQIKLDANGSPLTVIVSQHDIAEERDWDDVPHPDGHMTLYSARGSHAGMLKPTRQWRGSPYPDENDGKGRPLSVELEQLTGEEPWLGWAGTWGGTKNVIASSPTGPATRDWWADPAKLLA